ncbi:MAG: AI-2E family transporter [Gammaproteobacteria bacterium]|nr:AI-2E family transporter [Gammaproteobacteria bacterium]
MTDSQKWFWFVAVFTLGWLIYLLAPVLTPFLVAVGLAYLGDPLVDRLEKYKLSRTLAVIMVFSILTILFLLFLLLLVPQIEKQVMYLLQKLPEYLDALQNKVIPWLAAQLGLTDIRVDMGTIKQWLSGHWQQAGGFARAVLGSLSMSGLAIIGWVGSLVLVPVVTFYLLRDWDLLIKRVHAFIPRNIEAKVTRIAKESDDVLGAFMRGQMLVMLALAVIYSLGLWVVGLKLALLIGLIAGLVSFVPYLGFILGILMAGVAIILQTGQLIDLAYVGIVFAIGQVLESVVLTPALVGDRIGLHPVAVIFAVMAGGQLFGFVGVLLALPVAAVLAVILRHVHASYVNSDMYDQSKPVDL